MFVLHAQRRSTQSSSCILPQRGPLCQGDTFDLCQEKVSRTTSPPSTKSQASQRPINASGSFACWNVELTVRRAWWVGGLWGDGGRFLSVATTTSTATRTVEGKEWLTSVASWRRCVCVYLREDSVQVFARPGGLIWCKAAA